MAKLERQKRHEEEELVEGLKSKVVKDRNLPTLIRPRVRLQPAKTRWAHLPK